MRYEDAAEQVRVIKADGTELVAWMPKMNTNVLWLDEHQARYAAATDLPCKCGGRAERGWTCCEACRNRMDDERWKENYAKHAVQWNGEMPLAVGDSGDQYFWDEGELSDYLYEKAKSGVSLEDIRIVMCEPDGGRHFEMSEFLCDHLPEDKDLDDKEINATVNKWIKEHSPFCWWPDAKKPVNVESFRKIWDEIQEQLKSETERA